VMRWVIWFT